MLPILASLPVVATNSQNQTFVIRATVTVLLVLYFEAIALGAQQATLSIMEFAFQLVPEAIFPHLEPALPARTTALHVLQQ